MDRGRWGRALTRWTQAVQRRALPLVAAALLLTAAAALYTIQTLTINTNTEEMISPEVPFRRNDRAFKKVFGQFRDLVLIVIDGASPGQAEEAASRLAGRLRGAGGRFRRVYVPGGEPFFRRHGLLFLGVEELARLADRLADAEPLLAVLARDPSLRGVAEILEAALEGGDGAPAGELEAFLRRMREVALAAREGRPRVLRWDALLAPGAPGGGASSARRLVIAQLRLDHATLRPAAEALAAIRRAAAEEGIRPGNGLRLRLTGPVALNQEELDSVRLGGATASVLSFFLVLGLLVLGLRSWRLVLLTAATLLMGLVWTAGFAALAVGQLNLISVAFGVLFIGLGVDFGIHMSLRYREELAGGGPPAAALVRAARGVGGGLALSALSAAAGFYAFLPTDYRGLAELGLIAGTGMFIALFANLTVLPALLALFPGRPSPSPARRAGEAPLLAVLVERHGRAILWAAALLCLGGAAAVPWARFDANPLNLKNPEAESVATFLSLARDPRTSPYAAHVLAASLEAADALAARLEKLPAVEGTVTLSSFVPARQEEKLRILDDMAIFLTPVLRPPAKAPPPDAGARRLAFGRLRARLRAAAGAGGRLARAAGRLEEALGRLAEGGEPAEAALAGLERRLTVRLPPALARLREALSAGRVGPADLPPGLRAWWVGPGGRARVQVLPAGGISDIRELRRFAEAVQALAPTATGTPIILTEAGRAVVAAFREATLLALLLISALLLLVLRRLRDVCLVLAPLLLAGVLTAAASVLLDLPFNFANVIVLPLLLGLGVSSGIHLVVRQREEGEGSRVLASSTSRAVLFSALTTIAAFGSLALSDHRGMKSMGQLLAIAITFTLISTLMVLPSFMAELTRAREGGTKAP